MANTEYSRILFKRSTVGGVTPTAPTGTTIDNTWLSTDLLIGEGFLNVADDKFWFRTNNGLVEVSLSGISSSNYYTDSVYLTGNTLTFNRTDTPDAYSVDLTPILTGVSSTDYYVTGGTYSSGTLTLTRNDGNDVTVTGFTSGVNSYTTGATLSNGVISFDRNDLLDAYNVDINPALNNYLPLNVTGNTTVSVDNGQILSITGTTGTTLYNYITYGTTGNKINGSVINSTHSLLVNQNTTSTDIFTVSASETGGARLAYGDSGGTITSLFVSKSTARIESSIPTFNGLTYDIDYSPNYTNRS